MRTPQILFRLGIALAMCLLATVGGSQQSLTDARLIHALQRGGYVLYLRHCQTDPTQADTDTLHLDNIAAQRQLTKQGEAQAKGIGDAFRTLRIPVGTVWTSQLHRAQEVARLAEWSQARPTLEITEPQNMPPVEAQRRAAVLREWLATKPQAGTNTMLVAHRPNLQDAAGKEFGDFKEGEMAVFLPQGNLKYKLVARILPDKWPTWAKTYGPH